MSILLLSVSHHTAPMSTVSALSLTADETMKLCHGIAATDHVDEVAVLSTCNRTEVYARVDRFHAGLDEVTAALAAAGGGDLGSLQQHCAVYFDEGAVAHAFAVAAGLDSMVVGESQILGQFRTALAIGQQAGTVGTSLNALFQQGIRVGKRVQTETEIGAAGRSLVTSAYEVVTETGGGLEGRRVLVIGAGSMASLAARTAAAHGARVVAVNRTHERARHLTASIEGATAVPWSHRRAALAEADVVVACTGAKGLVLDAADLAGTPVTHVVDLALPRDVDPAVDSMLQLITLETLAARADHEDPAGVGAARQLVATEVADFLASRRAAQVAPTVVALRSMASDVVGAELQRLDGRLPELGEAERAEIARTVRRVVDKLLHHPTVRVQEFAADQQVDYAAALRDLFALDPQSVAAVMSAPGSPGRSAEDPQ
ncbi:glutamyl-tRNA reductase [Propionibacteriaceae bacterium Y1700]|uniref:glutamyl-tRNA reductase n=1 Tax=Microlunatus sp. Y1700 TaxID=3418487 RepID=UPI003DA72CE1